MKTLGNLTFATVTAIIPQGHDFYGFSKGEKSPYFKSETRSDWSEICGISPNFHNEPSAPVEGDLLVGIAVEGGNTGHRFLWWLPACAEFKILVDLLTNPVNPAKKKEKLKKLGRIGRCDYQVAALALAYNDIDTLVEMQKTDSNVETILCNLSHASHRIDLWHSFVREAAIKGVTLRYVHKHQMFETSFNSPANAFAAAASHAA